MALCLSRFDSGLRIQLFLYIKVVVIKTLSDSHIGSIAENLAMVYCSERGYHPHQPMMGLSLPHDFLLLEDFVPIKIQVKNITTSKRYQKGKLCVQYRLETRRKPSSIRNKLNPYKSYKNGDFDFAFCLIRELKIFYIIPFDVFVARKTITFGNVLENETTPKTDWIKKYRNNWGQIDELINQKKQLLNPSFPGVRVDGHPATNVYLE